MSRATRFLLFASASALWILPIGAWISGYYADRIIVVLFTAFILLISFLVSLALLIRIFHFKKMTLFSRFSPFLASFALLTITHLFSSPLAYHGFSTRMGQFDQNEFTSLAKDVVSTMKEMDLDPYYFDHLSKEHDQLVTKLATKYPILIISLMPARIIVDDEYISIFWGGGLTGGYGVVISEQSDSHFRFLDETSSLIHLYDNVILYSQS